jgi:heme iron utilization protein
LDAATESALCELLRVQPIGALGTLHRRPGGAEPFVSMVPVAWLGADAIIHVSALAQHTRDLREDPHVSLMLTAPRVAGDHPLALARATLQADASPVGADDDDRAQAAAAYLGRFAQAEQTFALGDFMLVRLRPRSLRFVAGFGRAQSLGAAAFAALVARRLSGA